MGNKIMKKKLTRQGFWLRKLELKTIKITKPVHDALKIEAKQQKKKISMWRFADRLLRKVLGL